MCPTKGDFALELEAWNKYAYNSGDDEGEKFNGQDWDWS